MTIMMMDYRHGHRGRRTPRLHHLYIIMMMIVINHDDCHSWLVLWHWHWQLAAARAVLECNPNHNVVVLEARTRVGGRVHTLSESDVICSTSNFVLDLFQAGQ